MAIKKSPGQSILHHTIGMTVAVVMLYPILWMVGSSLTSQAGIFSGRLSILPDEWLFSNYAEGWRGFGRYGFSLFFRNSFIITILSTVGAVLSSAVVAFGFARIRFVGARFWFALMISTLMLPFEIRMIPQYLLFHRLGWINTMLPIVVPAWFGASAFFIFLMVQFMRGIPKELDESAYVDGCGRFRIFLSIILPLTTPALMTAAIFSFYWTWNDFIQPLVYLNRPRLYTVSVALRLFADPTSVSNWGAMFAMATLSVIPVIVVFLLLQRYIVEGISSTGLKG